MTSQPVPSAAVTIEWGAAAIAPDLDRLGYEEALLIGARAGGAQDR